MKIVKRKQNRQPSKSQTAILETPSLRLVGVKAQPGCPFDHFVTSGKNGKVKLEGEPSAYKYKELSGNRRFLFCTHGHIWIRIVHGEESGGRIIINKSENIGENQ